MKKNIYEILFFLTGCMFLTACAEDYAELDKGSNVLTLTASTQTLVLNEINHADDALTLKWTTGTNYGTGNKITYKLEVAKAGTNFANAYSESLGSGVYEWTKTVEELNILLSDKLDIVTGTKADLEARITASVVDAEETSTQTSSTSFSVTSYKPVTTTLYLIGDATPTAWSVFEPTEMERSETGVFTWTGKLTVGNLKFITTKGELLPSYNKAESADGLKLVYRSSDSGPDGQFTITKDAIYLVTADLLNLTLTVTETDGSAVRFEKVYFVGSFTNWAFMQMVKDPLRINLFHYGDVFEWNNGGEFKFGTAEGWADMLFAGEANAPYTSTSVVYNSKDDNKWLMKESECGKAYKIALDVTKNKEKMLMKPFTPYTGLYLVGSASPSAWDLANATAMEATSSPYEFTWRGLLSVGELKISCDKKTDWSGAWFMPDTKDKAPTGTTENMLFVDKSSTDFKALYPDVNLGDVDMKWKIAVAGTYVITANQLKETISIVKQ
nr:SusF/SusE family outer membrane protein [uncultured Bacteroides sp.]